MLALALTDPAGTDYALSQPFFVLVGSYVFQGYTIGRAVRSKRRRNRN